VFDGSWVIRVLRRIPVNAHGTILTLMSNDDPQAPTLAEVRWGSGRVGPVSLIDLIKKGSPKRRRFLAHSRVRPVGIYLRDQGQE
jgi:hypothetical protein